MTLLQRVEAKFKSRLNRYKSKLSNAVGADRINQGAKIKATIECLQDVQCAIDKEKAKNGTTR